MLFCGRGSRSDILGMDDLQQGLFSALDKLGAPRKVLVVPPDITRVHSQAGTLTRLLYEYYGKYLTHILPAIGTHTAMSEAEISSMFGDIPRKLFQVHHWRKDLRTLGEVPEEYLAEISENRVFYSWPVQVNKLLVEGRFDLILSVGQVVPHEVIGMANYHKNILVGIGGLESIHKSHFLGAVYGMERIMGKIESPVRQLLRYAAHQFLKDLPIVYILTVVDRTEEGRLVVRGLFIGDDDECFIQAARLSQEVNITLLDHPVQKVVVYLDPQEFKSTWLGNKSIYRTRMAIADGGELIVLAPGVRTFGEDQEIDQLIRRFGYRTTPEILDLVNKYPELQKNLATAAHLIHGSSEDRFTITYCPGGLSAQEIRQVNFHFGDLSEMLQKYPPKKLQEGKNILWEGEEIYFISNPALGLWAVKEKF